MNYDETRRQVAYDLTLEYIKQNKMLNACFNNIPGKLEEIDKIYNSFYNSLSAKKIIQR